MPLLSTLAAHADASTSHSHLETALVATGAGVLFTSIGFLLVTDYKGARRRLMNPDEAPAGEALRRFNIRVIFGGNRERFQHHRTHVTPVIVGAGFMIFGGVSLLVGVVSDITLLIKAL